MQSLLRCGGGDRTALRCAHRHSCYGSRKNHRSSADPRFFRPRPFAISAAGSARFTPRQPKIHRRWLAVLGRRGSNHRFSSVAKRQKRHPPKGMPFLVQLSNSNPNSSHRQTRAQRKRVAAEKEEQRRECALTFEKSRSKRYKACSDVVPVTGLEPVRCRQRWILSPLRLPIPSHRRG